MNLKFDTFSANKVVDFVVVVYQVYQLWSIIIYIILDVFAVVLESNNPAIW